ncbi:galactokinase [Aureibacter tunicatorum]|uniref:Galactokinase n=1 Tax=Aureibacter tunicatorum TaxID=866807 RepID=A0AAE3XP64_9BACT|nr:galactokinase [Aureibacter tunicatorum]MDR6240557.1 galactokinase [Aureibacter tunicatorum]BDD06582.1 galactokinase [Aureibacter tunicatorum]
MVNDKIISEKFIELYENTPVISRSPGRVNLIGEHTDYNDGFVLPAAIDKEIMFAIAKNDSNNCNVYSFDLKRKAAFSMETLEKIDQNWCNYVIGVVAELKNKGVDVQGFDCVFGGDVPLGAGLSSSAALECALATGLNDIFEGGLNKEELAKVSQLAEHNYAGVKCGIMDQFASIFGKEGYAVRLDCRSLEYEYFPLNIEGYSLLLLDTQVKHSLASSEYNTRREQCESGVETLKKHYPSIKNLRDVTLQMLEEHSSELDELTYKRCKYVIEENGRLVRGCADLQSGDLKSFGKEMYGSHYGLQNEYEVSCPELDFLVEQTVEKDYVLGARMMGGGFGGCTINLVKNEHLDELVAEVTPIYLKQFGKNLKHYKVVTGQGARVEKEIAK